MGNQVLEHGRQAKPALEQGRLVLITAGLAIALPFISANALTLALGGVALSAGIAQLLRLGSATDNHRQLLSSPRAWYLSMGL